MRQSIFRVLTGFVSTAMLWAVWIGRANQRLDEQLLQVAMAVVFLLYCFRGERAADTALELLFGKTPRRIPQEHSPAGGIDGGPADSDESATADSEPANATAW